MTIPPISGIISSHTPDSPEKIKDAASQFEGLLIGQILKSAHQDSDGAWGGESDPASASAMDFANDYFARAMAAKGGLGLSNMIVNGLERQAAKSQAPKLTPDQ
jgi:flagellar protein FlgJ